MTPHAAEAESKPTPTVTVEGPPAALDACPALRGALGFLVEGLEGRPPDEVASVLARLLAQASPCAGSLRVILRDGLRVGESEAACGLVVPAEETTFGHADIVAEGDDYGVYRLRIAPGCAIPTHEHRRTDEWEYALSGNLTLQGEPFAIGDAVRWPVRFAHRWENLGLDEAVIVCIDRPRFDAADELPVPMAHLEKCPPTFRSPCDLEER